MGNLSIRLKLIIIFILIKVLPLILITYIAYEGIIKLNNYINSNTKFLFSQSEQIILDTANKSIDDSIKNLDKKSQHSLERLSVEISSKVAEFLYQRDEDILFLSTLTPNKTTYDSFYNNKQRDILIHEPYFYDENTNKWISSNKPSKEKRVLTQATLEDNKKEFNYVDPIKFDKKRIPIYKEIVFFDLWGKEKIKISQINKKLLDISNKNNTYIKAENYYKKIQNLQKGEIYVSEVIGAYVPSKIIGTFNKAKTNKAGIKFDPKQHGYAGKENPVGKKFKGIIRFITPVFKENKKIGFISLALDHEHIMQFTDTVNPTNKNPIQNIADASVGNYAFMWDFEGKNISHARDYFIYGYNKDTGEGIKPWISLDIEKKFKNNTKTINEFLKTYPKFEEQSLNKKPNIEQILKDGNAALDCRYLNFAPQCTGWMQVTQNGGYGSFIIYWSNVWKLTTAATIPYYTGQYGNSKRGFGFVTIGANVDEFHAAANQTKKDVDKILIEQTNNMKKIVHQNESKVDEFISLLINELNIVTVIMVILVIAIALWLSNFISKKIEKLLIGTQRFSNEQLDYRIDVTSNDEIGKLESSFNLMAKKIDNLIKKEKDLNISLEKKIKEEVESNREKDIRLLEQSKMASMGDMLANIAHQWRQPLNVISTATSGMQIKRAFGNLDDETFEKLIKSINQNVQYLSKTIDTFRNFLREKKELSNIVVQDSITNILNIVNATLNSHHITLEKDIASEPLKVKLITGELEQVLINIINNAKDALVENNIEEPIIKLSFEYNEEYFTIKIEDNAGGISEDIIDKIFEPYFTTKHKSQGTGLGLHMSYRIIKESLNGEISVKNINGGAKFLIKVPIKCNKIVNFS